MTLSRIRLPRIKVPPIKEWQNTRRLIAIVLAAGTLGWAYGWEVRVQREILVRECERDNRQAQGIRDFVLSFTNRPDVVARLNASFEIRDCRAEAQRD